MRPTADKILIGINNILISDILPELHSTYAMIQVALISVMVNQLTLVWQNTSQFPLIEENKDLRDVLLAASTTLKATKRDYKDKALEGLIPRIDAELQKECRSGEQYPSIQSLLEENCKLKEILVQTIVALEQISQKYESRALNDIRKKIRAHLRKHLDRQLDMLGMRIQA